MDAAVVDRIAARHVAVGPLAFRPPWWIELFRWYEDEYQHAQRLLAGERGESPLRVERVQMGPLTMAYPKGFKEKLDQMVAQFRERKAPDIDGAYMVVTSYPCVDGKLVLEPRTRAQRKAARKAAARGGYPGLVPMERP